MKDQERTEILEELLAEATTLLDDNKAMFGLFNKQYFFQFKAKVDAYRSGVKHSIAFPGLKNHKTSANGE